jgi:hypothetical protein
VRFKLATFRAGTVQVRYFAETDSTQPLAEDSHTYTADGQNHEFRRNSPCDLFRLIAIDVPVAVQNSLLQNVLFEIGQPFLGKISFVTRIYCIILRFLQFVRLINR